MVSSDKNKGNFVNVAVFSGTIVSRAQEAMQVNMAESHTLEDPTLSVTGQCI